MQKQRPRQLNLGPKHGQNVFAIRRVDLEKCFPYWGCMLKSDTRAKNYDCLKISHTNYKNYPYSTEFSTQLGCVFP